MRKLTLISLLAALTSLSISLPATAHGGPDLPAAAPAIGGKFELIDQNGKTFRDTQLHGKVALVFFGFTNCPDVCPITAAIITQALALLGDKANRVMPVMISVDPKRDTPEALKTYLSFFDRRFVGLTGSPRKIASVAAAYKAYYNDPTANSSSNHDAHADHAKHASHQGHNEHHAPANYRVEHSSFIYLIGPDGQYRQHLSYNEAPEALAAAVRKHLD